MTKRLVVVAGPNGAGKSTLVTHHLRRRLPVVNPDDIAIERGEPTEILAAGREAVARRLGLIAEGRSLAIETTLTGQGELIFMRRAAVADYRIILVYVGVSDVYLSLSRVRARVLLGGHDVPIDDLMRRYARSIDNLPVAAAIADRVFVIENDGQRRRLLRKIVDGHDRLRTSLPAWASF